MRVSEYYIGPHLPVPGCSIAPKSLGLLPRSSAPLKHQVILERSTIYRQSDARRRLLSAAHALFHDRGYEAVGVAELCSVADVNKGSFYHFFASKRDLMLEVVAGAWDETGLLAEWEASPPGQPLAQLRRYLQDLFAYHYASLENGGRVRGSLLGNLALELSARDAGAADRLQDQFARETRAFRHLIGAAVERGEVRVADPDRTAEALVACVQGLLLLAKVRNDLGVLPANEGELLRLAGVQSNT